MTAEWLLVSLIAYMFPGNLKMQISCAQVAAVHALKLF